MYWLMRSASWPPVSVVSPRKSTGLSLLRLRAPTVRWPAWRGWRSRSSDERSRVGVPPTRRAGGESSTRVIQHRLERVPETLVLALGIRRSGYLGDPPRRRRSCIPAGRYISSFAQKTASALNSPSRGLPSLVGHLLGEVGPPLDLLLDPRVIQVELLGVGHSAHLELEARTRRAFLRPLLGLLLRRHVEDPQPVEQFLGLGVWAVGDDRRIRVEIDDEALVGSGQALAGEHDAGLDELLVVAAHRFDDLVEVDVLLRHGLLGLGGRAHDQHVARHFCLLLVGKGRVHSCCSGAPRNYVERQPTQIDTRR